MRIEAVRRFNRVVTQRVGALQDAYLARERSLGEARLLWEVGERGCEVRELRERLGLNSGYLSRLLRRLEGDGLVEVVPSDGDGRVRTVQLTASGMREVGVLDRRSDELAESILAPLSESQRERLVAAMGDVERLLTASMVEVAETDPRAAAARFCVDSYAAELASRFATGFDRERSRPVLDEEVTPPAGLLLVATLFGRPVGCGSLKFHGAEPAEIKRLWVSDDVRGVGLGRRLLAELEQRAVQNGVERVRLDTNKTLTEAIALYRASGYAEIPAYNDEPYADHWFEKRLTGRTGPTG